MRKLLKLVRRNIKLFFKDKGLFFTALVTPIILLVLYSIFLGDVFRNAFINGIPKAYRGLLSESMLDALVGGQLVSSILSVSCVTVAFCSNCVMVQDKSSRVIRDLKVSPLAPATLSLSYYISTLISTLIICFVAIGVSLIYISTIGWYMTFSDVLLLFLDVLVLSLFGTAFSSVVNHFLRSQGQMSAVSSIITVGYGFICGAYMPISTLNEGLQNILVYLPGTYGTSLVRTHTMQGMFNEIISQGVPDKVVESLKFSIDCSHKISDKVVSIGEMYIFLLTAIIVLMSIYILLNTLKIKRKIKKQAEKKDL